MEPSSPTHLLKEHYGSIDTLVTEVKRNASAQGYAVCQLRKKESQSTGVLDTCYLCCARDLVTGNHIRIENCFVDRAMLPSSDNQLHA